MSKHRWKDSLYPITVGDPERHMRTAIFWLAAAIRDDDPTSRNAEGYAHCLSVAGAHIRAARKGLGVETSRRKGVLADDSDLMLYAMRCATYALAAAGDSTACVSWLRSAEACLRTMWKRAQS